MTNASQAALAALALYNKNHQVNTQHSYNPPIAHQASGRANSLSGNRSNSMRSYTYNPKPSYQVGPASNRSYSLRSNSLRGAPPVRSNSLSQKPAVAAAGRASQAHRPNHPVQKTPQVPRTKSLTRSPLSQRTNSLTGPNRRLNSFLGFNEDDEYNEDDIVSTTRTTKVVDSSGRTCSITTETIRTLPDGSNVVETTTKNLSRPSSRSSSFRNNSMTMNYANVNYNLNKIDEDLQDFDYNYLDEPVSRPPQLNCGNENPLAKKRSPQTLGPAFEEPSRVQDDAPIAPRAPRAPREQFDPAPPALASASPPLKSILKQSPQISQISQVPQVPQQVPPLDSETDRLKNNISPNMEDYKDAHEQLATPYSPPQKATLPSNASAGNSIKFLAEVEEIPYQAEPENRASILHAEALKQEREKQESIRMYDQAMKVAMAKVYGTPATDVLNFSPETYQEESPRVNTDELVDKKLKEDHKRERDEGVDANYIYENHHRDFPIYSLRGKDDLGSSTRKERIKEEQKHQKEEEKRREELNRAIEKEKRKEEKNEAKRQRKSSKKPFTSILGIKIRRGSLGSVGMSPTSGEQEKVHEAELEFSSESGSKVAAHQPLTGSEGLGVVAPTQAAAFNSSQSTGVPPTQNHEFSSTQTAGLPSTQGSGIPATQNEAPTQAAAIASTRAPELSPAQNVGHDHEVSTSETRGFSSTQNSGIPPTQNDAPTQAAAVASTRVPGTPSNQNDGDYHELSSTGLPSTQSSGIHSAQRKAPTQTAAVASTRVPEVSHTHNDGDFSTASEGLTPTAGSPPIQTPNSTHNFSQKTEHAFPNSKASHSENFATPSGQQASAYVTPQSETASIFESIDKEVAESPAVEKIQQPEPLDISVPPRSPLRDSGVVEKERHMRSLSEGSNMTDFLNHPAQPAAPTAIGEVDEAFHDSRDDFVDVPDDFVNDEPLHADRAAPETLIDEEPFRVIHLPASSREAEAVPGLESPSAAKVNQTQPVPAAADVPERPVSEQAGAIGQPTGLDEPTVDLQQSSGGIHQATGVAYGDTLEKQPIEAPVRKGPAQELPTIVSDERGNVVVLDTDMKQERSDYTTLDPGSPTSKGKLSSPNNGLVTASSSDSAVNIPAPLKEHLAHRAEVNPEIANTSAGALEPSAAAETRYDPEQRHLSATTGTGSAYSERAEPSQVRREPIATGAIAGGAPGPQMHHEVPDSLGVRHHTEEARQQQQQQQQRPHTFAEKLESEPAGTGVPDTLGVRNHTARAGQDHPSYSSGEATEVSVPSQQEGNGEPAKTKTKKKRGHKFKKMIDKYFISR